MADHSINASLYVNGVWTDVTTDVRQTYPVTLVRGGGEVSQAPRPSTLSLTLDDRAGKYRPDRATSSLYGKVGRNTPVSVAGGVFEISSWQPDRTVEFNASTGRGDQVTEIDAAGLLRRIGTWRRPVVSALGGTIPQECGTDLIGYWPFDDGPRATYPKPQVGVLAASRLNYNSKFAQTDVPAGANYSATVGAVGAITGKFQPASTTAGWRVGVGLKLNDVPTDPLDQRVLYLATQNYTWQVWANNTTWFLRINSNSTGNIVTATADYADVGSPAFWHWMVLEVDPSGGSSSNWTLTWYWEQDVVTHSISGTVAIPPQALDVWQVSGNDVVKDGNFTQLVGATGTTADLLSGNMLAAFNGWPGELAANRLGRLLNLYGLSWEIVGDPSSTEPMGPQRPGTLLEQLREIRDTEGGMLYDSIDSLAVVLRTRASLYAQTPALALTFGTNVAAPFLPVLDDLQAANLVTVSQNVGGSFTAEDTTSLMSTQDPPNGIGEYAREVNVNYSTDARLEARAWWEVALGTVADARYASVRIDLDASPALESACNALRPGDRVTVTGAEPDVVDLLVVGITDLRETRKRRTVTLTCRPYDVYATGVWDATGSQWDLRSSTMNAGATSTATSLTFKQTGDEVWSTTGLPYDLMIAGERVTATAMGGRTGTGPWTQTATVTRSVNGVVKALPTGAEVHVATPGRWGL